MGAVEQQDTGLQDTIVDDVLLPIATYELGIAIIVLTAGILLLSLTASGWSWLQTAARYIAGQACIDDIHITIDYRCDEYG